MTVAIEHEDDWSTVVVRLDNGDEVGRYTIADDPRAEAAAMRKMLRAVIAEAQAPYREVLDAIQSPGTIADYGNGWAVEQARRALKELP